MFAVSNRKANRLLKTKRKRAKGDVKRLASGFMTTTSTLLQPNSNDNDEGEPEVKRVRTLLLNTPLQMSDTTTTTSGDDDTKLVISAISSVKDNGLYENDTKLLKLIFPTCYQLETFMFLYDFFTLVGEDEKDHVNTNNTTTDTTTSTVFGTQRSHFQYLATNTNGCNSATTSKLLKQEDIQSMIVNVSLEEEDFKRKICSFPNLRIVHENISTCPLAMSECTVNYTVLVLEVKIYSLYRQFILNESNKSSSSKLRNNHYCARVIPDEDVFMEMKEMWKSYVFTEKYRPHGRRGSDTLNHSNIDTALWSQYADKNNTYLTFLQRNGLMSPSGEPVTSLPSLSLSIFVNYCSFKIEEIQKGTCVNRLKKRIQLEVGPHTLIQYVSIFAEMYKAFITDVKDANKIISDYEAVKQKSMKHHTDTTQQQQHDSSASATATVVPVRRGRKRKNTEDIIGQYKSLEHKKTKYESVRACGGTVPRRQSPAQWSVSAPDLHTLADVASASTTYDQKQELLNETELQEILNNLFSPTTATDDGDCNVIQDKPPPVVILNPPPPPSSPMEYAYVKDITRCMEDSSKFTTNNTATNDTDDDDDDDDDDIGGER